jgi:hypothetical protein
LDNRCGSGVEVLDCAARNCKILGIGEDGWMDGWMERGREERWRDGWMNGCVKANYRDVYGV